MRVIDAREEEEDLRGSYIYDHIIWRGPRGGGERIQAKGAIK